MLCLTTKKSYVKLRANWKLFVRKRSFRSQILCAYTSDWYNEKTQTSKCVAVYGGCMFSGKTGHSYRVITQVGDFGLSKLKNTTFFNCKIWERNTSMDGS